MSFEAFGTPLLVVMVLLAVFAFGFSSVFVIWSSFFAKHVPISLERLAALAFIVGLALLAIAVAFFPKT